MKSWLKGTETIAIIDTVRAEQVELGLIASNKDQLISSAKFYLVATVVMPKVVNQDWSFYGEFYKVRIAKVKILISICTDPLLIRHSDKVRLFV